MKIRYLAVLSVAIAAGTPSGAALFGSSPAEAAGPVAVSFKSDVLPVFQVHCASCHTGPDGDGYKASGLDLTSYQGVMKGTKFGPMVVAGDPDSSNLVRLIDWKVSPEIRMPHNQKQLSTDERDAIREWVRQGAKNN